MIPAWVGVSNEIIKLIVRNNRYPRVSCLVISDDPLPANSMAGGHLWGWDWVWDVNDDRAIHLYANPDGEDTGYEIRSRG